MPRLPTYFISHGGGPWPWLANMRQSLATLEVVARPHARRNRHDAQRRSAWCPAIGRQPDFAVMSAAKPGMVYDYGGFPPETYKIVYPAPGAPEIGPAHRRADRRRRPADPSGPQTRL